MVIDGKPSDHSKVHELDFAAGCVAAFAALGASLGVPVDAGPDDAFAASSSSTCFNSAAQSMSFISSFQEARASLNSSRSMVPELSESAALNTSSTSSISTSSTGIEIASAHALRIGSISSFWMLPLPSTSNFLNRASSAALSLMYALYFPTTFMTVPLVIDPPHELTSVATISPSAAASGWKDLCD
eukprot:CAMPEP_0115860510 /NCGR_PEP_ID=MMETSP0287-20121206/17166_1 /TAXON_ID=412157 /ORGANISM="Chrysochromulina rotalis, Strain UIO044" /LENGTH=186 /DNA_ID=CAMNT_0003314839 /DNA_START=212 /DNA_END=773 /DNA_ORIENTATION=-